MTLISGRARTIAPRRALATESYRFLNSADSKKPRFLVNARLRALADPHIVPPFRREALQLGLNPPADPLAQPAISSQSPMSDSPSATAKLPRDLAAEKGLVNVQIDGVWHQFPKGTRMIEACRQVDTIVPHYCYHPKLSSPGNCRMCLVQMGMPPRPKPGEEPARDEEGYQPIGWMPRPVIACANTVSENMGIRTTGEGQP